ncbi:DUF5959 family protein [Streptomyces halstedii]|uniref:DUF5959 family protein n=1 Tax=Streptomyces halstedii TaxID=1944 RepID=UPI0038074C55
MGCPARRPGKSHPASGLVAVLVFGRCPRYSLSAARLGSWADALDQLDAGEDVAWMEMSSGPSIFIQLTGERDCPEVVVEDEDGSMVTVRVPLVPPDNWIADHRQRLRRASDHWVPMLSG